MRRIAAAATIALAALLPAGGGSFAGPAAVFHRPIISLGASQSSNWSGYNQGTLEQGGKLFGSVSATWTVPMASQHRPNEAEYSSSWIGVGGGCVDAGCTVTDSTLIQTGTEQDVAKSGTASYWAWWEVIPLPSIQITGMTIRPGDRMTASIAEATPGSNVWTIKLRNATNGDSFATTVPYDSTHLTAEWIVETPVVIGGGGGVTVGPLPDLTTVHFDGARTNGHNAGLKPSEAIQLVDPSSGQVLATPSAPDAQNNGFNDCTYATTCRALR